MNPLYIVKILLAFFFIQFSTLALASEANEVSLVMVKKVGLGNNLRPIAIRQALNTMTYKSLQNRVGEAKAKALVESQIAQTLPGYQVQWDKNLADSYALFFTPVELMSIMEEGPESKYFPKVTAKQNDLSKTMQLKSQRLLADLVSKVMIAVDSQSK